MEGEKGFDAELEKWTAENAESRKREAEDERLLWPMKRRLNFGWKKQPKWWLIGITWTA